METWLAILIILGCVLALLVLLVEWHRRRRSLRRQMENMERAKPAPITEELLNRALQKRQEMIAERPRHIDLVEKPAAPPPVPSNPLGVRLAEPEPELIPEPPQAAQNPVQKMAIEQWDDVHVVAPKKERPAATPRQMPATQEFSAVRGREEKKAAKPLSVDWGDVEVRRDTRKP